MIISSDGSVTGSVDVSKLDQLNPSSDEAKAQVDALKRDIELGQKQSQADAERLAQAAFDSSPLVSEPPQDLRDPQGKSTGTPEQGASTGVQLQDAEVQSTTKASAVGDPTGQGDQGGSKSSSKSSGSK